MATMNFSVPEEVKKAFNEAFAGQNKSAIIAELMVRAIEEERMRRERKKAVDRIIDRRVLKEPVSQDDMKAAREELRS